MLPVPLTSRAPPPVGGAGGAGGACSKKLCIHVVEQTQVSPLDWGAGWGTRAWCRPLGWGAIWHLETSRPPRAPHSRKQWNASLGRWRKSKVMEKPTVLDGTSEVAPRGGDGEDHVLGPEAQLLFGQQANNKRMTPVLYRFVFSDRHAVLCHAS